MQHNYLFLALLGATLCIAAGSTLKASDSYQACEIIQDTFQLVPPGIDASEWELYADDQRMPITSTSEITLRDYQGFCIAEQNTSYLWQVREYLSTVTTTFEDSELTLRFICIDSFSGVPAGVQSCEDVATQDLRLDPKYVDQVMADQEHILYSDIQNTYATTKDTCSTVEPWELVKISARRISGPGFDCAVSGLRPAGTGLVSVDANCSVDGKFTTDPPGLDLGNFADHFELSLPGRDEWLALYPCSPIPELQ